MASSTRVGVIALAAVLVAGGAGGCALWSPEEAAPIVGVVHTTEVRVAPEVGGQLAAIKVHKGDHVLAGDVGACARHVVRGLIERLLRGGFAAGEVGGTIEL